MAGFRACKCLLGFYRTHLFKGCRPCDQDGLKCIDDYVTLRSGYWWNWKNQTHKSFYEQFIIAIINNTFSPIVRTNSANHSLLEYPYSLPQPHKCPRQESCIGGLDSSCAVGYRGPLCEICSAEYYKQFTICKECPTKKWMVGQLSILAAVIVIVMFVIIWTSKRKSKETEERSSVDIILGRLKIVIGFYQVTFGLLESFSYVKWPDSLAVIGKYSEVLQLNVLQNAPIHCFFPRLKVDAFGSLFAMLAMNCCCHLRGNWWLRIDKTYPDAENFERGRENEENFANKRARIQKLVFLPLRDVLKYLLEYSKRSSPCLPRNLPLRNRGKLSKILKS